MISIIIPTFNSERTIGKLLQIIFRYEHTSYEVIIIDDNSYDNTKNILNRFKDNHLLKIIVNQKNIGPAASRNKGARFAKGNILLFMDSDILIKKNYIQKVEDYFNENKDRNIVIGICSKFPLNNNIFSKYMALMENYFWIKNKRESSTILATRFCAIRKKVFGQLGGFNEQYKKPTVENLELGYRIMKQNRIYVDKSIIIKHHYHGFLRSMKNACIYGKQWFDIFIKRKRFENVFATPLISLGKSSAFISFIFLILSIFSPYLIITSILFLIIYLLTHLRFMLFLIKNSRLFLIYIIFDYLLTISINLGATITIINRIFIKTSK